ncbi:hypothetical protein DBV15_03741 [Temnothorax longispinosus]|uniref:Uncharacterized protein n=1 Tax=Temnothorax longispinosus TaxID=300112 RepID=A0A4S2KVR0_9HYME|nr:hypothetical protein DBV15_03741 [Temnothorax longispinosus]
MELSGPGTKSVKRRMFSNTSRLVTPLVGRALSSLHAVQIPRWKRLRDKMSSRVDYDVGKVAVRLKLGYLRRKRMLDDSSRGNARILPEMSLIAGTSFKYLSLNIIARSNVVRTQGLDSEVTGESEASMQDEGFAAPESALAEGRCTAAPPKRPQDSAQTATAARAKINARCLRSGQATAPIFADKHWASGVQRGPEFAEQGN